jgi:hypothetical protein
MSDGKIRRAMGHSGRQRNRSNFRRRFLTDFKDLCEKQFGLVLDRYLYIDTIKVLSKQRMSPEEFCKLAKLNGGKILIGRSKCWEYPYGRILQQSTASARKFLATASPEHIVGRFDIALDLVTANKEDAVVVHRLLRRSLTQPWRGKRRRRGRCKSTDYLCQPGTGRNVAIYSDRVSKIDGRPACHVEFRFDRALSCGRFGIRRLDDFRKLNFGAAIRRNVRLAFLLASEAFDLLVNDQMRKSGDDRCSTEEVLHIWLSRWFDQDNWINTPTQEWIDRSEALAKELGLAIPLPNVVLSLQADLLLGGGNYRVIRG